MRVVVIFVGIVDIASVSNAPGPQTSSSAFSQLSVHECSFRGKEAQALFKGERVRRFQDIARVAQRKLMQLRDQELALPPEPIR